MRHLQIEWNSVSLSACECECEICECVSIKYISDVCIMYVGTKRRVLGHRLRSPLPHIGPLLYNRYPHAPLAPARHINLITLPTPGKDKLTTSSSSSLTTHRQPTLGDILLWKLRTHIKAAIDGAVGHKGMALEQASGAGN